jgi:gamma-glutamyltranspeptidase / glutathione hydrolase
MVVTNNPLASGAGAQMLLAGGNAVDAAVAALFALTVAEPMMVGVLGGGITHLRLAGGRHIILDGLSTAPRAARADMYQPVEPGSRTSRETMGRANELGGSAVAVPGALAGWCQALANHGTMPLADVLAPAIALAERGFVASPYLADCISDCATGISRDAGLASLFLPGGDSLRAGERLVQGDYAQSLRLIAREGAAALYQGELGAALAAHMAAQGGLVDQADLAAYRVIERGPVRGTYRGHEVIGPPPPASAGVHIVQMLNILEGHDVGALGFGRADSIHLMAEVLKIAFADRAMATADPDFVDVPVARLTSKSYGDEQRAMIRMDRAQAWPSGLSANQAAQDQVASPESANTTHVTVADSQGNVVASTQTLNGLFGACCLIPGTGMLANNYMYNFDPNPGRALSIAPGKRVFTSMAPMMVLKDGQPAFALGLPGGLRIFPSAMQAIINLIDHGMDLQSAVEAPRVWTEGGPLELEPGFGDGVVAELASRGHRITHVSRIGGGMNAIAFNADGTMTGAACWRADGTPVGISGGLARAGVRFSL